MIHFPEFSTPSELVACHPPAGEWFRSLFGGTSPSLDDAQSLARAILAGWLDESADAEGFRAVGAILRKVLHSKRVLLRHRWSPPDDRWRRAEEVLAGVPDFRCTVATGCFCWSWGDADSGVLPYPCESPEFGLFLDGVLKIRPTQFSEVEPLLR